MKKNILSGICIAVILSHSPNLTAETSVRSELLSYSNLNPISVAQKLAIQDKTKSIDEQIDGHLNFLLALPFEQRQYIFPALFDSPYVPKKIRTHPEIAIWEGKIPTDINPELRELADKYLKDLNPIYYAFVFPKAKQREVDAPFQREGDSIRQKKSPLITVANVSHYPKIQEILKQPDELQKNPNLALLKKNDISMVENGLTALRNYLNQKIKDDSSAIEEYELLSLYYIDPYKERINPFQTHIERLKLMKRLEPLGQELKKIGFASAEDFAIKADAFVRAYRAARVPYSTLTQARIYDNMKQQNNSEKKSIINTQMYKSYPQDVRLVQDNLNTVRQMFIKTDFQFVLNAETFDELRK